MTSYADLHHRLYWSPLYQRSSEWHRALLSAQWADVLMRRHDRRLPPGVGFSPFLFP